MEEYFEPAAPRDRLLAGAADLGLALVVLWFFRTLGWPFFGFVVSASYVLLRDGLEGRSLGKRWRKLCCIDLTTEKPCDWKTSCMRNLILALPVLGIFVAVWEFYISLKDSDYRRWGDRFANTFVVREASLHSAEA